MLHTDRRLTPFFWKGKKILQILKLRTKKLYNSIKRLCFYISYKKKQYFIYQSFIIRTKQQNKVCIFIFKICDLLLVCTDLDIILYGVRNVFGGVVRLLCSVCARCNDTLVVSSLWLWLKLLKTEVRTAGRSHIWQHIHALPAQFVPLN